MDNYMNEVVTRCAPRWAWEAMTEILWCAAHMRESTDARLALRAITLSCETPDLPAMSREYVVKFED
jgi:hypothetical protein